MRPATTLALLVLALTWCACASVPARQLPPGASDEGPDPLREFTGIWSGTSVSTIAAAKVRIEFDIHQEGKKFKGDYRCAAGDAAFCTNNIQRGWVHGQTSARGFTVSMEDSSWCLFMMDEFYPPLGDGEYTCYLGGMIEDRGTFELRSSPSASSEQESSAGAKPPQSQPKARH